MVTIKIRSASTVVLTVLVFCVLSGVGRAIDLCVDPGHGGTDPGSLIHYDEENWHEDDINLMVTKALQDTLEFYGYVAGINVIFTRLKDTSIILEDRYDTANSVEAETFISIHHNSGDSTTQQGTETWYCDDTLTGSGCGGWSSQPRVAFDTLAQKVYMRIRDAFGYAPRGVKEAGFLVLKCSQMMSTLTEASFVNTPYFDYEATLFHDSIEMHHGVEAGAIYNGWVSTLEGQGFGLVDYEYHYKRPNNDTANVKIQVGFAGDRYQYSVPYMGNWNWNEYICLNAIDFSKTDKKQNEYNYTFHHWEERDWTADTVIHCYDDLVNPIDFNVWWADDGMHYYAAYFTGGPFDLCLVDPSVETDEIMQNDTFTVKWTAPEGARLSCSLSIDLSTNGQTTWQFVAGPLAYNNNFPSGNTGTYDWLVPEMSSNNCYLRLAAWDRAGNHDTLISHRFGIDCYAPTAQFEASIHAGQIPLTVDFADQSTHSPTGWYWDFGDGGTSTVQYPSHTYSLSGLYTVTLTATNQCGSDDTVMVDLIAASCDIVADFAVDKDSGSVPLYVLFSDASTPGYSGNYYLWDFGDGDSSLDMMNTSHRYDTAGFYTVALTVGLPCGAIDDTVKECFIQVTDGSGGPSKHAGDGVRADCYDCCIGIRGNVDNTGGEIPLVADLTYLVAYLFSGGPVPPCEKEGNVDGLVEGDFAVTVSDQMYLVAYLFSSGPSPPT